MALLQTLKTAVPLSLKESLHRNKSLPRELSVRLGHRLRGGPPIPPGELIHLVAGHSNPAWFLRGGQTASEAIRDTLARGGVEMTQLGSVLDFGCGVGRILRHLKGMKGPRFYGTDYNPRLIEWCKRNLRAAEFGTNTLDGPLAYAPESFDLAYAFSVFTHLTEPLQFHWMGELARVLKPGGFLYFTAHGARYLDKLNPAERERFSAGRLVVKESELVGTNTCAAYHPESYVRRTLAGAFEVVGFVPEGARGDSMHDVYLLRKPLSSC